MQFLKLTKAVLLSVSALAAGYAAADSSIGHRVDAVPSSPTHKAGAHQGMMGHGNMCDDEKIAKCCKMMQMCQDMMQESGTINRCHDRHEQSGQPS